MSKNQKTLLQILFCLFLKSSKALCFSVSFIQLSKTHEAGKVKGKDLLVKRNELAFKNRGKINLG